MTSNTLRAVGLALAVALTLPAPLRLGAQEPANSAAGAPRVAITAGRSTILPVDFDITRLAITNPNIADAVVVTPREILIDGKAPGTISMIVWGDGRRLQYDLVVQPPVSALQQQLRALFPGEDIEVLQNDEALTLAGRVSSTAVSLKAAEIAGKTSPKLKVINMLQVPGGEQSQQVMLQVRFAEVNRQALLDRGISLFTGTQGYKDWIGRTTTGQFAAPVISGGVGQNAAQVGTLTFSDFLNLFLFNSNYDVGGLLKALQQRGLLQSLAEPNLVAYNGKEASFLAGGEIPIPVVQGNNAAAVTVMYKEYGIRLNFTPTIAGDVIRLQVKPEVSSLDFANGVTLNGFRIPALQSRRAETEVELRDGQSFAIAGLMNNVTQVDRQQIPALGNLPIIGYFFKSRSDRLARTELMVLVTPRLVRPLNPDEFPDLPTDDTSFLPAAGAPGAFQDAPGAPSGGARR